MRIAHVIDSLGRGGAENLVLSLAGQMKDAGHELFIIVLTDHVDYKELIEKGNVAVYPCGFSGTIWSASKLLRLIWCVRRLSRELDPDVLNTHMFLSDIVTRIAVGTKKPIVTTFHRNEEWWRHPASISKWLKRWLEATTARFFVRRFVAVSETAAAEAVEFLRIDPRRCSVVKNGVDTQRFRPAACNQTLPPRVIQVARFYSEKCHEVALRAFVIVSGALPSAELWLVGDGPRRADMEKLTDILGLTGKVRFLGLRDNINDLLVQCEVFWLTSRREGLPIALLEAMASGVVPVVTAVGDAATVVESGKNGYVVSVDDHAAIAQLTCTILTQPQLRRSLSRAANATVLRHYSIASTASAYLEEYSHAVEEL